MANCMRCKRLILCDRDKVFFYRVTGKECDDYVSDGKGVKDGKKRLSK